VLVEYLIPPHSTATTQGEHVFFNIDSKGEKRSGLNATVGGLSRIVQPFRVAINAKGGDCWQTKTQKVYRKSVHGKNNNEDTEEQAREAQEE
jgi:hypothetical protein